MRELKNLLESLYKKLNKRGLVDPDPLKFLYDYPETKDREIIALLASSIAYGRVTQILKSIDKILLPIEGKPFDFVTSHSEKDFIKIYKGFVHRFTTDADIVRLLCGIRRVLKEFIVLFTCFFCGFARQIMRNASFLQIVNTCRWQLFCKLFLSIIIINIIVFRDLRIIFFAA